jgi:hypothetical protein
MGSLNLGWMLYNIVLLIETVSHVEVTATHGYDNGMVTDRLRYRHIHGIKMAKRLYLNYH